MNSVMANFGCMNNVRGYFSHLFIVFLYSCSLAQILNEKEELYSSAWKNLYSNPEKTITISEYIISHTNSNLEKSNALNLKAEALIIQGEYISALNTLLESLNLNDDTDNIEQLIIANIKLSELYRQLGIHSKSIETVKLIERYFRKGNLIKTQKEKLNFQLSYLKSGILIDQKKYNEAISLLKNNISGINLHEYANTEPFVIGKIYNQLARAYSLTSQFDSAEYYAKESFEISQKLALDETFNAYSLLELSKIYLQKNEIQKSLNIGFELSNLLDKVSDYMLKKNIHQFLADLYEEENDNTNFQIHNLKHIELNYLINSNQQKARDLILSLSEKNSIRENEGIFIKPHYVLGVAFLFTLLLLGGIFWYKHLTKLKYNYYKEYIGKLKQVEQTVINGEADGSFPKSNQIIPEKTEQVLLEKLEEFERRADFTKKNLTLNSVAKDLETNTRYLSEIVNKHKHKNFNAYLNELRVNFIVEKLRNDPRYLNYKISYLAEECGFSSHTSFTTVFKSVTGITPKVFIEFVKKESPVMN